MGSELEIGSPVSHSKLLLLAPPAHPYQPFFTVLNYISLSPQHIYLNLSVWILLFFDQVILKNETRYIKVLFHFLIQLPKIVLIYRNYISYSRLFYIIRVKLLGAFQLTLTCLH